MPSSAKMTMVFDATISPLEDNVKAARKTVGDFTITAQQSVDAIRKSFQELGSGGALDFTKRAQAQLTDYLRTVQASANARKAAFDDGSADGMLKAAEALDQVAAKQRLIAESALKATGATEAETRAIRMLADSSEIAAQRAARQADEMRLNASVIARVEQEMGGLTIASERAAIAGEHVAEGHARMGASGMIMQHVVRSTADSFSAGLPPMMIFTEQLGRVGEAAAMSGPNGALGKFGAFMGTGWGLALTAGISVLGTLIASLDLFGNKLAEAEKKLRENGEAERLNEEASKRYDQTLMGLVDTEKKLNDELEKEIRNQRELMGLRAAKAGQAAGDLAGSRDNAKAALDRAQSTYERDSAAGVDPDILAQDKRTVDAARKVYDDAATAALDAETTARKALIPVLRDQAKAASDPKLAATRSIEDRQSKLDKQFELKIISPQAYVAASSKLEDELSALKDTKSGSGSTNALGGMEALLRQLFPGVRIPSTTGGKHVSGSEHYTGHAIDFVPAGGMGAYSKEEVEQILADAGVKFSYGRKGVKQFFGPGDKGHSDHFHVGFTGSPTPESADRAQEAAARRAAAQAAQAARDDEALDAAYARAKADRTNAFRQGNLSIAEQADLDRQAVQDRLAERLVANSKLKREHQALDAYEAYTAKLEEQQITADELVKPQQQTLGVQNQLLQIQAQLAPTDRERAAIALKLLANEKQQALLNARSPDEKASIEQIYAGKEQVSRQQNAGPIEAYKQQLIHNTDDMNRALEGVAAHGLQGLEDGLIGLISGTESVASAFKKMAASIIADLARIAIEKAILSVFGLKDGGPVGIAHFATGGFVSGPGGPRDDRVPAMLSNGEFVMNAQAVRRYGSVIQAMNDGSLGHFASGGMVGYPAIPSAGALALRPVIVQQITLDARGAVMTEQLVSDLNRKMVAIGQAAMIGGAGLAQQNASDAAQQRIP